MGGKRLREGALWQHWLKVRRAAPQKIVVIEAATGQSWTAAALTEKAEHLSEALGDFRAGERVAFRLPNGALWLAWFLALQRARLAAIPLDASLPDLACAETARRFGASALVLSAGTQRLESRARRNAEACCIKVTSGTGAHPRAVICRSSHLLADGRHIIATMKIRPRDINLGVIPLGHSYGLGNLVMPLILQGTAVVCASDYLPRQIVDWISRHRVTVFPGVPALFRVLTALPGSGEDLRPLRTVISAGAVLAPVVAQAFHERFGRKIHNFYGASETGGICYDRTGAASLSGRSVGTPMESVRVSVKARRITVASSAVATQTGRWRLGDYGEWNARGELTLLGRAGREANIGGRKVHPLEIERTLRALAGVTDACVWPMKKEGRDSLAAAVETSCTQGKIEMALAEKLPVWKLPKSYLVLPEFPRSARGKLDVAALKAQLLSP